MKDQEQSIPQIQAYANNAKEHPKKQLELLARVVAEVGWRQNVEVNQKGVIIAGHGRYMAWQKFGMKFGLPDPWIIDDAGQTICGEHATFALTEEQEKMWRLADNQINAMTGFDMDMVIADLKDLSMPMLELTGFDKDLILETDDQDDIVPGAPKVPKSVMGDVYTLGKHKLICGDSTKVETYEKLMGAVSADCVFTDPPYNVNYKGHGKNTARGIESDNMDANVFDAFLANFFQSAARFAKGGGQDGMCFTRLQHKTNSKLPWRLLTSRYDVS